MMRKILKTILILLILVLVLILGIKVYMYQSAIHIAKQVAKNEEKDYYCKIIYKDSINNMTRINQIWKNDKFTKNLDEQINNSQNTKNVLTRWYDKEKNIEATLITGNNMLENYNTVHMTIGKFGQYSVFENSMYDGTWIFEADISGFEKAKSYVISVLFNSPIIKTETINGKKCYEISYGLVNKFRQKQYIEKETYLPVKTVDGVLEVDYEIEFRKITQEDINFPDLANYYTAITYDWSK